MVDERSLNECCACPKLACVASVALHRLLQSSRVRACNTSTGELRARVADELKRTLATLPRGAGPNRSELALAGEASLGRVLIYGIRQFAGQPGEEFLS